jgi:hypothetical protein
LFWRRCWSVPPRAPLAQASAGITSEHLLAAFRSLDLAGVYPRGMWRHQDPHIESCLTENFAELRAFAGHTKEHALGAIIQLT